MIVPTVECPDCGTEFDARRKFCPSCQLPRTQVTADLQRASEQTGIPFNELAVRAWEEEQRNPPSGDVEPVGPPPSDPPDIRRRNVRSLVVVFGLLFACAGILTAGAILGDDVESEANDPPATRRTATREQPTSFQVTYTVTTESAVGGVRVSYNNATGGLEHTNVNSNDTWTETFRLSAGGHAYVTASIAFDGPSGATVRCTQSVDGSLVDSQMARGAAGSVTCSSIVGLR